LEFPNCLAIIIINYTPAISRHLSRGRKYSCRAFALCRGTGRDTRRVPGYRAYFFCHDTTCRVACHATFFYRGSCHASFHASYISFSTTTSSECRSYSAPYK
jgi:hypothetical protein